MILKNGLLNSAGLAIKTSSSALAKSTNAFVYQLSNKLYTKAASDMPALTGTIADDHVGLYTFLIDADGTIETIKGVDVAITSNIDVRDSVYEKLNTDGTITNLTDKAIIGHLLVDNQSGSVFTGGTTALDATNVTVTYLNATGENLIQ